VPPGPKPSGGNYNLVPRVSHLPAQWEKADPDLPKNITKLRVGNRVYNKIASDHAFLFF